MIAAIVLLVLAIAAFAYAQSRKRKALTLDWPKTMGFQKLIGLTDTYLKHHGWEIYTPIHQTHIKVVTRNNETLRLILQPSMVEYNFTRLKDLSQVALEPGRRPLVCITTDEVPHHTRSLAAGGQVLLLHYKQLDIFRKSQGNQTQTVNAMVTALLESKGPAPLR